MLALAENYLKELRSVNDIRTLLFVAGFSDDECSAVLDERRTTHLDTTISNISPRILSHFPPDFVSDLARIDRVKRRLTAIYARSPVEKMRKKGERIGACAMAFMLLFDLLADRALLLPYSCNSRFCPTCSRARSAVLFSRAIDHLSGLWDRSFKTVNLLWITLTISSPQFGSLASGIDDLLYAFRTLRIGGSHRQPSLWHRNVKGYLWNLEVTINLRARSWHPHIHVLADAKYMHQPELDALWNMALKKRGRRGRVMIGQAYTTDSSGQVVLPGAGGWCVEQIHAAVKEVTKYQFKAIDSDRITADQVLEMTEALHNKRLLGSGGDWLIPAVDHSSPQYSKAFGLRQVLTFEECPTATLLSQSDPVGVAHFRACCDPFLAAGLARTYSASAFVQRADSESTDRKV